MMVPQNLFFVLIDGATAAPYKFLCMYRFLIIMESDLGPLLLSILNLTTHRVTRVILSEEDDKEERDNERG